MAPDGEFFMLRDDELHAAATAMHRRIPRKGKADIGGRMRVAQILRDANLGVQLLPERIAGSTNEVWRAGDYIVRVGFIPGAERLRREAVLAPHLPSAIHYPRVVASGIESFGEWIVVRNRPGVVLSEAWAHMTVEDRRSIVHELATDIKAVHEVDLGDAADELLFREGEGALALPHQLPASRILRMLEAARELPFVDYGLIEAAAEKTKELAGSIGAHERTGLVHGDLHFENVLVQNGIITALLDFEWCRKGPKEIDIDVLARFCANPSMHVGGTYPIETDAFKDVLRWFYEVYPELFEGEFLVDRLTLCGLAFEVPWLLKMPPTEPMSQLPDYHPLKQLKDLLEKGTHAERLGWLPRDEGHWSNIGK